MARFTRRRIELRNSGCFTASTLKRGRGQHRPVALWRTRSHGLGSNSRHGRRARRSGWWVGHRTLEFSSAFRRQKIPRSGYRATRMERHRPRRPESVSHLARQPVAARSDKQTAFRQRTRWSDHSRRQRHLRGGASCSQPADHRRSRPREALSRTVQKRRGGAAACVPDSDGHGPQCNSHGGARAERSSSDYRHAGAVSGSPSLALTQTLREPRLQRHLRERGERPAHQRSAVSGSCGDSA